MPLPALQRHLHPPEEELRKCRKIFSAAMIPAAALWFGAIAGCRSLPPGDPPEGNLVSNPAASDPVFKSEMVQQLAGLLIAGTLDFPGSGVALDCDSGTVAIAARALYEAGPVSGAFLAQEAKFRLRGRTDGLRRNFSFHSRDRLLWRKTFRLAR